MTTPEPVFLGYQRSDGSVGVRNHVLVIPTVICAAVVAERVAASIAPIGAALPHLAGCGQIGPDLNVTHETLAAYARHPNVGAVLVVALGCEQVVAQYLADTARQSGRPAQIVSIQGEGGTVRATARGTEIARELAAAIGRVERTSLPASSLVLSVKCGGSDYTSGLAPLVVLQKCRLRAGAGNPIVNPCPKVVASCADPELPYVVDRVCLHPDL